MNIKRLGEFAEIQTGPFGSQLHKEDYVLNGTPIVTVEHLGNRLFTEQNLPRVSDDDKQRLSKYILSEGDIVFSRVGSVDRCSYVDESHDGWMFSGRCLRVRPDKTVLPLYLYYYFCLEETKQFVRNIAVGATMPSINTKLMSEVPVAIPEIESQQRIADILSSIDSMIELNETINDNLLQQALCLYSSLIGESAKNGYIGDYCSIKSGFAFKSKWWQDSGVPVVKIGSINQDYLNLSDCSHVSDDKIPFANDFIVSGGDLLIAMTGATIGKFTMVPKVSETILVNQRVGKFFLGEKPIAKLPFIYCTLKQPNIISEVINRGQGSAQPNISATDIMTIPCVIPNTDEIDQFNRELSPMFEMIINNQFENTILSNTRDTILPKLMSGELDVSDLDL